jgi:hypothetical protein
MSTPFKYIDSSSVSLGTSYFFPQNQLSFFATQSYSGSVNFGLFAEDVIEFSVYDTTQTLNYWNLLQTESIITSHSRQYTNINNISKNYTYVTETQPFVTLNGTFQQSGSLPEILLSPINDLNNIGYGDGSYTVNYNFFRNVVSSPSSSNNLFIKDISPSRTEIKVTPQLLRNTSVSSEQFVNEQFYAFGNKIPYVKFIIDYIKSNI